MKILPAGVLVKGYEEEGGDASAIHFYTVSSSSNEFGHWPSEIIKNCDW